MILMFTSITESCQIRNLVQTNTVPSDKYCEMFHQEPTPISFKFDCIDLVLIVTQASNLHDRRIFHLPELFWDTGLRYKLLYHCLL